MSADGAWLRTSLLPPGTLQDMETWELMRLVRKVFVELSRREGVTAVEEGQLELPFGLDLLDRSIAQ